MNAYSRPVSNLIGELSKLPSIGKKTASRLALHIINMEKGEVEKLSKAIIEAKENIKFCHICCNISDTDPCQICADKSRDRSTVMVVEDPKSVVALEKSEEYRGLYHVLGGTISPTSGISPDMLKIKELLQRLANDDVKEVILATNPTIDGEATASYIAKLIKPFNIEVSRLATGLPMGADLEFADEITLVKALEGRVSMYGQ